MSFIYSTNILFVLAQAEAQKPPAWAPFVPFIALAIMLYFVVFAIPKKKEKEHNNMLAGLKLNDKVILNGGIVGIVVGIKDHTISIRSAESKLEVQKTAIAQITEKAEAAK
jgi:preprotein translocase subunit YajC